MCRSSLDLQRNRAGHRLQAWLRAAACFGSVDAPLLRRRRADGDPHGDDVRLPTDNPDGDRAGEVAGDERGEE